MAGHGAQCQRGQHIRFGLLLKGVAKTLIALSGIERSEPSEIGIALEWPGLAQLPSVP